MKNPNPYTFRTTNAIQYNDNEPEFNDSDNEEEQTPNRNSTQNGNTNFFNYDDSKRHPKKRKLDSFVSSHESRENHANWSEEESFALLEIWGERYMELGRRSLRGEDWVEVSEKVVDRCRIERNELECRNQLDVLKNRYKKEKVKTESKWVYFKKMDGLLSTRNRGFCGLGCGVDSGEYVFMNPRVYLDRSNVLDEMRDSPAESDEDNDNIDNEEEEGVYGRVLADSIRKFGEVYEKIEESKRKQMVELETMREEFRRELEMQKKIIVERAEAEIAKIREMDEDEDEDVGDEEVDEGGNEDEDEEEEEEEDTDTSVGNFGD